MRKEEGGLGEEPETVVPDPVAFGEFLEEGNEELEVGGY